MLTDLLDRIHAALTAQVDALGGIFEKATDRDEATIKAIRSLSNKWLCLAWVGGGQGHGEHQLNLKGACEADVFIAIARRPKLERQRDKSATDIEDDLSLLNLWERVRGLVYRIRFGTLMASEDAPVPVDGRIYFQSRDNYLCGHEPMEMGKFSIERKVFEIAEAAGDTKGRKELLWAETVWTVKLALPALDENNNDLSTHWLCV